MLINGGFMDTKRIIADIDAEISKLRQVRELLSSAAIKKSPGRPKSTEPKVAKPKKRKISAKGRAAISAAMKARWAKAKKTARKTTKTASPTKAVKTAPVG
jgi:hypothetical protein